MICVGDIVNLGFLMRQLTDAGTPRSLRGRVRAFISALIEAGILFWSPDPARIGATEP